MTRAQRLRRILTPAAIAAVAIVVDVEMADEKGAWLIGGIAIGFTLIVNVPWFTPDLARSESLARTLAPLALPLMVVGMIGMVEQAKWLQLVAGLVGITVGWGCFVVPENPRTQATLDWNHKGLQELMKLVRSGVGLAAGAVIVAALVFLAFEDSVFIRDRGGWSGMAFLAALILWAVAAATRVIAYARTWARAVVALLLLATFGSLPFFAGLLPGDPPPANVTALRTFAGLTLIAAVVAWFVDHRPRKPLQALPERPADFAASIGLGAAVLASAALAFAAVLGLIRTADPGNDARAPKLGLLKPARVSDRPVQLDPAAQALAAKYYPVLALTRHERWGPEPADAFSRQPDVILTGPSAAETLSPRLDQLPKSCPIGTGEACWTLKQPDCTDGQPECAPDTDLDHPQHRSIYVRVQPVEPIALPRKFGGPGDLATIVQYWIFYRYDLWNVRALTGRLTQQHEGDWENVTLGFTAATAGEEPQPLFVAYSAHCAGTVLAWGSAPKARSDEDPRTHPLVGVAEGSHANYPRVRQAHAPDWIGCDGRPKGLLSLVGYASNIRDITEYGHIWYPRDLIPAVATKPPMSFPGTWGLDDRTELKGPETRRLDRRRGPKSPPLQPAWKNPLRAIFCADYRGARCNAALRALDPSSYPPTPADG